MRVSIVIPVLNSHEVVRRHVLHWERMGIPKDVEIILVDDGSDPPLETDSSLVRIHATHDNRPWTWAPARNAGARISTGDYLLMTDIDYIITRSLLDDVRRFTGDKMRFRREFAVLDEDGEFVQGIATLMEYGLPAERIAAKGFRMPPHPNNFAMRRDLFFEMGGYREDLVENEYPQREDGLFKRKWAEWLAAGKVEDHHNRPTIFMYPNGQFCGDVDFNPFGLFHNHTRKTRKNPWHRKIERAKA